MKKSLEDDEKIPALNPFMIQICLHLNMFSRVSDLEGNSVIISDILHRILNIAMKLVEIIALFEEHADKFDPSPTQKFNGFRSLIHLTERSMDSYYVFLLNQVFPSEVNIESFNFKLYVKKMNNCRSMLSSIFFLIKFGEAILLSLLKNIHNNGPFLRQRSLSFGSIPDSQKVLSDSLSEDREDFVGFGKFRIKSEDQSASSMSRKTLINKENPDFFRLFVETNDPLNNFLVDAHLFADKIFFAEDIGFQFNKSLRLAITSVAIAMISFYDGFYGSNNKYTRIMTSLAYGPIYTSNSEKRAAKIIQVQKNPTVDFIKNFWSITDTYNVNIFANFILPQVTVNRKIIIGEESLSVPRLNRKSPLILPPLVQKSFYLRLYSYFQYTSGDIPDNKGGQSSKIKPLSDFLIFHIHGGGFIAQSPKTHEVYLKTWVNQLTVPFVSVNYSKSPENKFPIALEECFYAYCWVLKNLEKVGSNGKKIVFVGDSAGGNLCFSVLQKVISAKIRKPDGLVILYPCMLMKPSISPSRLLSLCDILLSTGVVKNCLDAYLPDKITEEVKPYIKKFNFNDKKSYGSIQYENKEYKSIIEKLQNEHFFEPETPNKVLHKRNCSTGSRKMSKKLKSYLNTKDEEREFMSEKFTKIKNLAIYEKKDYVNHSEPEPKPLEKFKAIVELSLMYEKMNWSVEKELISKSPYVSPLYASNKVLKQFPQLYIIGCDMDPLLDEYIEFARKMYSIQQHCELEIFKGLSHGFLQFHFASEDARKASEYTLNCITKCFL